ncbi:phospholipid carrier-dependent glycosyltransferase [Candidatus Microgenomates bacterium]|jgi:4-amino-4-deoxy-L-arabinose transferase-like glycosyltransferase|nr:MAG: phospholipid carrier-dependent glycosyltransferase [Candidatus Microgenomates bacterium]
MKKKQVFLLLIIIIIASVLRFYKLNQYPPALFSDEVDLGYQAYSFLKTGADYFGNKWPVSFRSFADFRAPLYLYSAAGTISIFGLNEWGVRLPAAIYGVLGVIAFFFLVLQISKNYSFSLLASFILAILPWHIHYSRAGFEVSALFFLLSLGLFSFFRFLEKKKLLFLLFSLFALSLCFYTYATSRLFLPLLCFAALLIYGKEIFSFNLKKLSVSFFVCFIFLSPFIKDAFWGEGLHRFSYLNIFSDSNLKFEIDRQRLVDAVHNREQVVGMATPKFAYVFHNKPLSWATTIVRSFISSFSFDFLFLKGDPNLRHGIGKMGGVLIVFLPFLLLGLFKVFETLKAGKGSLLSAKESLFFLSFLFLAPLPSSITYDGGTHATRLFFMVLPLSLLVALGIWEFFTWIKKAKIRNALIVFTGFLLSINLVNYLHFYYYHYPLESERLWHYGFKEGITKLNKLSESYDKVILSSSYEPPMIFFLFWSKHEPSLFKAKDYQYFSNDWFEGKQIGKYYFGKLKSSFLDQYLTSQLKEENLEKILILAGRNDFGSDLNHKIPSLLSAVDKVNLPSKEPILFLLRTKTYEELEKERVELVK